MTPIEILMVFGVPAMFLAAGLIVFVATRDPRDRAGKTRLHPGE